jgi:hypothetical protein
MRNKASIALGAAVVLLAGGGVGAALSWPLKAKLFPLVIGIPLLCLAAAELWLSLRTRVAPGTTVDDVPRELALRRAALAAAWIAGFFAAIVLLGFVLAVPAFVFLYLRIQGRESGLFSAVFAAAVWAAFYGLFDRLLHLPFPPGVLAAVF